MWSVFASGAFSNIPISACQITIEIYKSPIWENKELRVWQLFTHFYDSEISLWKQLMGEVFVGRVRSRAVFVNELQTSRFLTKFTANANGKFRLLFLLSNRPNREIHKYLLITINADICVAYTNCKPHYVMIEDIYSWLDLSRWTERLSRGLLSSKIGSSLCSAKLPELQSSRKRPLMVAVTHCRRSVFYLVFGSSFRFHTPAFL